MTFANAIEYLSAGKAAKRTSWGGYVKKTTTSGTTDGSYTLTFKNKGGTEYAYLYNATAGTWTAPATTIPFDADIMASMIADDWVTGDATAFETARGSSGTW